MTLDRDKLAGVIRTAYETGMPGKRDIDAADAVIAHLSAVPVEPKQNTPIGPAYVGVMPASPESSRQIWTMYCRECGVEEFMADSPDDAALLAHRDKHNAEVHPAVPVEGDREEAGSIFNENPRDEVRLDENRRAVRVSPLPVEGDREAVEEAFTRIQAFAIGADAFRDAAMREDFATVADALSRSPLPVEGDREASVAEQKIATVLALDTSEWAKKCPLCGSAPGTPCYGNGAMPRSMTHSGRSVTLNDVLGILSEGSPLPVEGDKRIELNPAPGWYVFGTHVESDTSLEFYGAEFTEDGMPLWERPVEGEVARRCGFSLDQGCLCDLPNGHTGLHECQRHRFTDRPMFGEVAP